MSTTLSYTQQAELMLCAAEAARQFVCEFDEPLDPSVTDWDSEAWADARHTLAWIALLLPAASQEAWEAYQRVLVAETHRLCADQWRVFTGEETRQRDALTGQPAQPGLWYAEPKDYTGDILYGPAFATRAAAEAWADGQPAEDDE